MVLPTILSIVFRFVGFLRRGELSSMAAAWGSTSLRPCTNVLYRGLLMTACSRDFPLHLAYMTAPGLNRTDLPGLSDKACHRCAIGWTDLPGKMQPARASISADHLSLMPKSNHLFASATASLQAASILYGFMKAHSSSATA